MKKKCPLFLLCMVSVAFAQDIRNNPQSNHGNRFEQLGTILPTPNEYRTASGAPGNRYWQQRCDYDIVCELDETTQKLTGSETITYTNNSPDVLTYLWLQLDENEHSKVNNAGYEIESRMNRFVGTEEIARLNNKEDKHGHKIKSVTEISGKALPYTINRTMMRIDLPQPLKPGQRFSFKVDWHYFLTNRVGGGVRGGRGGYEFFPEDGNHIFTIAQWYPRLCVYSDFQGWQHQQFSGRGEFALTFGNFKVQMTVPADHAVGATGECQNYAQVLPANVQNRWKQAQTAKDVVELVTLNEAKAKEKTKSTAKKTWVFNASNVRDFAWTSSRKFIWDAMPQYVEGKKVMCMSFYPKEAYALYRKYSTKVVAHTIKTYSQFTIPYPYPVAQSVEAANGMEYPMICFNFGRTEKDGTYDLGTKYGMIGVVVHEVGHNFFPMIVNSDERQWSWMDEGLNTFVEYLSEELFENGFPARRGPAYTITDYMSLPKNMLEPIMTNSDNIREFGPNAYSKPATGLNILRETIMGRQLFDFAFREYARRWAFKHPTPADFFRTMEDASAVDLDWFWRGWFYNIDPVDISIDTVRAFRLDVDANPSEPEGIGRFGAGAGNGRQVKPFDDISKIRNREDKNITFAVDADKSLVDFYTYWKPWENPDTTAPRRGGGG
ncbi:MAG: M1 family metallopeptidase, partial [Dinghuibacter sp.]|nr:M1 family metallopeptidase [Dinghuibacter sp.]